MASKEAHNSDNLSETRALTSVSNIDSVILVDVVNLGGFLAEPIHHPHPVPEERVGGCACQTWSPTRP